MPTTAPAPPAPPEAPAAASPNPSTPTSEQAGRMAERFRAVRRRTEALCETLETEDFVVQTVEHVSPTKWHLAHTSWFFETFILKEHAPGYEPIDERYAYLFNSYYVQAGERHCRDRRGYISRPTVRQVFDFRRHVDAHVLRLWDAADEALRRALAPLLEIGLHHEQQHQELMLTDIKHVLGVNPLRPAFREQAEAPRREIPELQWIGFDEGLFEIGFDGAGFCYDNELPRHRTYLRGFQLANRLVTNGEFMAFMADGGYERTPLWLSEGWAWVEENGWTEPFYWEKKEGQWHVFTLGGMREVDPEAPACHISYFEADAFARWADARLPTEAEWEVAARALPVEGNFVDEETFHPARAPQREGLVQMYGDVWEWTRSPYAPYPGYAPLPGAIGEYNGKFMSSQFVLRGGSCATSQAHVRPTYRNFFHPDACWQFTGFRLARDA